MILLSPNIIAQKRFTAIVLQFKLYTLSTTLSPTRSWTICFWLGQNTNIIQDAIKKEIL